MFVLQKLVHQSEEKVRDLFEELEKAEILLTNSHDFFDQKEIGKLNEDPEFGLALRDEEERMDQMEESAQSASSIKQRQAAPTPESDQSARKLRIRRRNLGNNRCSSGLWHDVSKIFLPTAPSLLIL
ncbi:unnamed protein product [Caenorhabditis nigoni]